MKQPRWWVKGFMHWFARRYRLRLDEAKLTFDDFENLDQMFTRELKEGLRPICGDIVHPADSKIAQGGTIKNGQMIQAKGWTYTVGDLIGAHEEAADFEDGFFITYYLCPTDYHRVHSPIDGRLTRVRHIPGRLWPVNPYSVEHVKNLFAINERVVFFLETAFGSAAVVMVGATNVGKISLSVGPAWITNQGHQQVREHTLETSLAIAAGQELGQFHLGSTAIVLYPKACQIQDIAIGKQVLYGQGLRG